jgi:hypothetical protein
MYRFHVEWFILDKLNKIEVEEHYWVEIQNRLQF